MNVMQVKFRKNKKLASPEIVIEANELSQNVKNIIQKIENMMDVSPKIIPIKSKDKILMIKLADLSLIEVMGEKLTFFVKDERIKANGHLNNFIKQINNEDFVQVSRHAALNLNHLEALELSFGGALIAKLSNGAKTSVSRKYVKEIEIRLGIN